MTPAELERLRAQTLLAAAGLAIVALAAVAGVLLLGLRDTGPTGRVVSAGSAEIVPRRVVPIRAKPHVPDGPLFANTSFWNRGLVAATPVDPNSATLVAGLVAEVQRERAADIGPWIGTGSGSTPVYRVRAAQKRVRVILDERGVHGGKALQRAFAAVPIPDDAKASPGADRHMTVWQPSSDSLWELFGARQVAGGWHARWGGAIRNVSKSPGYYTASAWPGATRNWGATASSLPIVGGTMLLDELAKGRLDHALAINLPAPRAGSFAWPAQRTDGTGPVTAIPEGARLRLDPTLDIGSLHVPKLTRMIALAAQRYGFVVRDQTHHAITLLGEVPTRSTRSTAYRPFFRGKTPATLLAGFPWDRLQVVRMRLCTAAPCRAR